MRLLSEAGNVVDAHLPSDRETGRPRGFAFVTFSNEAEAAEAIRRFHDKDLNGRKMVVNPAEPRRPAGSGGFGGGGGRPAGGGGRPAGGGGRPAGGGGFGGGRPGAAPPPPPAFFDRGGPPRDSFRSKGSRRGLRAKKRSL